MWNAIEDGLCQAELLSHLLECIGFIFAGALCEQCHELRILAYKGNLGVKIIHFSEDKCAPFCRFEDEGFLTSEASAQQGQARW